MRRGSGVKHLVHTANSYPMEIPMLFSHLLHDMEREPGTAANQINTGPTLHLRPPAYTNVQSAKLRPKMEFNERSIHQGSGFGGPAAN